MQHDVAPRTVINGTAQPPVRGTLSDVCAQFYDRLNTFLKKSPTSDLEKRVQEQTERSLAVFRESLEKYELSSLSLSYNGGKDCLVLLVLYLASLHEHFVSLKSKQQSTSPSFPSSIPSIYAFPPDPFPAVTSFVASSSKTYHLDLAHIPTNPRPPAGSSLPKVTIRDAFETYLSPRPNIRAIFVGIRRTDPHGEKLTFFDRTDHGWPDFMRIHPVIDWRLAEIWCFLRAEEICGGSGGAIDGDNHSQVKFEWCELYDEGYTSLGGRGDTLPNPKLRRGDGTFRPAWELEVDEEERLGRG